LPVLWRCGSGLLRAGYTHTHTHTHTYILYVCMYVCMYIRMYTAVGVSYKRGVRAHAREREMGFVNVKERTLSVKPFNR
jgi:hypothetical protein